MALMEFWIDAKELSSVRLGCDYCKAETIFVAGNLDLANEVKCANCETTMAGARKVLADFDRFMDGLKKTSRLIRFKASFPGHGPAPG